MNTPYGPESRGVARAAPSVFGLHPLIAIAAAAVIAVCGVGIATMLMNRTDAVAPPQPVALTSAPTAPVEIPPPAQSSVAPEEAAPPPPKPVASKPAARPAPKPAHKPTARAQIAAASDSEPSAPIYYPPSAPAPCRDCAVVESTREVKVAGQGSGLGAIAGGVVGGLLGNRVGEGRGRTAATVLGAVGGGFAGNAVEKSTKAGMQYQLAVRFEDGTSQTFTRAEPWPFGSGDRVKVIDGQVVPN